MVTRPTRKLQMVMSKSNIGRYKLCQLILNVFSFAILVQWVAEEAPQLDLLMSIGGIEKRT